MNTVPRKRVPCATSSPSLLPQQVSRSPSGLPRWCPQWSSRALRLLLSPAAFASLLLALACTAWLYSQSCSGPLQGGSQAFALGPFPAYTRPQQPQPLAGGAPLVDIVYVSAFPQHLRSSLRSLCHFLAPEGVGSVHLVVPDRMVAFFQESLPGLQCPPAPGAARRLGFRVWGESTLVPAFTQAARHTGTVRQMALKLAAATIVSAPFYLVMDSDVYARQPFGVADLLLPSSDGRLRARTGLDQLDYAQPDSWFRNSAHLLQTPLVADTDAFCAAQGAPSPAAQWFAATGNATVPPDAPFALQPGLQPGARVYGACRSGRGHATHVTPMLLSRELVADVLLPRLARAAAASAGHGSWVTALLDYQALREAQCWHALTSLFSGARFYTWTEYSLYFVAGVASGALDQFHAFPPQGGITSYRHSIMMPDAYEAADWDAIFTDASDPAPFFIVHSWFNKPLAVTNARLARHIPGLAEAEAPVAVPQPSALPLYA